MPLPTHEPAIGKKFKPARPLQPFPAPSAIISIPDVEASSSSNNSAISRPLSPVRTPRKDNRRDVIDLSSPDPPSSSKRFAPKKRLSSENPATFDRSSPAPKRARCDSSADKENCFRVVHSAATPDADDVTMSGIDVRDLPRPARTTFVRQPATVPSTPSKRKRAVPAVQDKYSTVVSHSDLKTKSLSELESLLVKNKMLRFQTMQSLVDDDAETSESDHTTLKAMDQVVKERIVAIEFTIAALKAGRPVNTGNDMEVEMPTEPNTPMSNPPPISAAKRSATPTPSAPREDPSVMEISTTRNGNDSQTSYTAVGSAQPSQLTKKRSIIDLDNDDDDEEDLWETVDNMPLDEYRTHLTLPIAPIRAPLTEALPAQNTLVRAPSPESLPASSPPDPADKTSYDSRCYPEIMEKLKKVFRLHEFRPNQLKAVTATLEGKDVFVLMPTGGGKSLCFQLPAICETGTTRGVTVVVSPLISLMNDQVRALKEKKISVIKFSSELSADERKDAMNRLNSVRSKPSLVYLTPEGLDGSTSITTILQRLYREKQLARFVIDEAHLISSWGRDFRGSYNCLGDIRENYPGIPIMALTATANEECKQDIVSRLHIESCVMLTSSFNRSNLYYEVKVREKGFMQDVANKIRACQGGSGVIYCLSRKKCEDTAKELRDRYGIDADHYHADMPKEERQHVQEEWHHGRIQVIVATIAFGMGIDKANVRFVYHLHIPKSLDGYYQETGRAGRDGEPANCIMYYLGADATSLNSMIDKSQDASSEEKKRQKDGVAEVMSYCRNTVQCRRVQVLNHFGQKFEAADCHNNCDNCMCDGEIVEEDMTAIAIKLVKLTKSMLLKKHTNITKSTIIDVIRGSKSKGLITAGHDREEFYGAAQALHKDKVGRLVDCLHDMEALRDKVVSNKLGYANTYTILGQHAQKLMNGGMPVIVQFREGTAKTPATTRSRNNKPASIQVKGKGKNRVVPADEDDIDSFSGDDDTFVNFDDEVVEAPSMVKAPQSKRQNSTNRPPQSAGASTSRHFAPVSAPIAIPPARLSEDERNNILVEALHVWRGEMAAKENCEDDQEILTDEDIQMLVLTKPNLSDVRDLEPTFMMYTNETRDSIARKCQKYGTAIVGIFTSRNAFMQSAGSRLAPVAPAPPPAAAPARQRSFKPVPTSKR